MPDWSDALPSTDEWYVALDSLSTLGELSAQIAAEEIRFCPAYLVYAGSRETLRRPGYPGEVAEPRPVKAGLNAPEEAFLIFGVYRRRQIELLDDEAEGGERVITLGCAEDNDIFLPDESVAAVHAHLVRDDGDVFLRPGPEAKLTPLKLNGAPVSQADKRGVPLRSHDVITLGDVELAFLLAADVQDLIRRLP